MASPTIRMLWGIAKSPELGMTDEELHLLVLSHTGKDSIKQLNKRELGVMVSVLAGMKDSSTKGAKKRKHQTGNPATVNQRKKVYKLAEELGWTKKNLSAGTMKNPQIVKAMEEDTMAEMKIVRNEKGVFFEFKDADMMDCAVMCGALQQTIGLEAYKRGMSMDDVRDNMLELHLKAMEQLKEQADREESGNGS